MACREQKLCKWDKADVKKHFDEYVRMLGKAEFVCVKCGRASGSKKCLCKAKKTDSA